MNEMQVFENKQFGKVRTITENGKTLFCGADIAKPLKYSRPSEAVARHCKGTLKRRILTNGGEQDMLFIPEGDVYRLIARSNLPEAEKFESWIFDEVLPSIRKNGGYNMPTQKAMEMNLFRVKETAITHSDGHTTVSKTTKVTGKGQQYFINMFLKNGH